MSAENINYPRISVGTTSVSSEEMNQMRNGEREWNPHFIERNSDYLDVFTMKYLDLINDKIGDLDWGIWFIQGSIETNWWLCDIYCVDMETANKIVSIISSNPLPQLKMDFSRLGSVQDYIARL